MRAKSDSLAARRRKQAEAVPRRKPADAASPARRGPQTRLPRAERRAQILDKACDFFAEYGLTAQTRGLAEACGVSQRLLYSFFPNKAALLREVYREHIEGPFKAVWLAQLRDRSRSIEERLDDFYRDYYAVVLTRRWLRLFLYASLAEESMAQTYISSILTEMLQVVVHEAAFDAGLPVPEDEATLHELGWILHGTVSHLAIRRHIYHNPNPLDTDAVIRMQVRAFLAGLRALLRAQPRPDGSRTNRGGKATRSRAPKGRDPGTQRAAYIVD